MPSNPKLRWSEIVIAMIGTALLLMLVFFPVVFQGKTLMPTSHTFGVTATGPYAKNEPLVIFSPYNDAGAPAWQTIPLHELALKMYREGDWPLWNPYNGLGAPLAASMQPAAFYLPQLAFSLFSAANMHWDGYFIFRIFVGIFFTYLFVRLLGWSYLAAGVAGAFFGLNNFFFAYLPNVQLNVDMLLPLLLFANEYYLQKLNRRGFLLLAAAVFLAVTGGMPEATFFALLMASAYCLTSAVRHYYKHGAKYIFKLITRRVLPAYIIGFGLAGFLLLPFYEYLQFAYTYHAPEAKYGQAAAAIWSPGWVLLLFAGSGLIGLMKKSAKQRAWPLFFAIVTAIYFTKSVGHPIVQWIGKLPLFELVYFPLFFAPAAVFSLAIMAGAGAQLLKNAYQSLLNILRNYRWQKMLAPGFYLALIMLLAIHIVEILPLDYGRRADNLAAPPSIGYLKNASEAAPVRIFANSDVFIPQTIAPFGIADLRFLDALHPMVFVNILKTLTADNYEWRNDPAAYFTNEGALHFFGNGLPLNHPLLKLWGVTHVVNARTDSVFHRSLMRYFRPETAAAINRLINNAPIDGELVFSDDIADVYQNKQPLPRGYWVKDYIVEPDADRTVKQLVANANDYRTKVILETEPPYYSPANGALGDGQVKIVVYQPNRVVINTSAKTNGLLVLSDAFYPGWRASIDGRATDILRANAAERAVAAPAGNHTVEFSYRPLSYRLGTLASLASGGALIIFMMLIKRRGQTLA